MPKQVVTLKQITFASSTMIIGTSILTKQLYTYMKHEAWIAVVLGFVACLFVFMIYSSLAKRLPGLSLMEISKAVFGRVIGTTVSALYIFYFFTIACLNVNIMGSFVKGFVLPNSPSVLIMFLFVFVCAWAARKGPLNLMKYSILLTMTSAVILLLITLLLIPKMDVKNLEPMLSLPAVNYAIGTHSIAMIPFCDPFFLMMFLPYVGNTSGFGKALVNGLIIGVLFLIVIVIRDASVLGQGLASFNLPSLISIRMIAVGDILTRIDIVYIGIVLMLTFYKVSLLLYATVSGIKRVLKLDSENILVNIIGALLILYAMTVFRSSSEHAQWLVNGAAHLLHTLIVFVLPLLTLVVASVRGMSLEATTAADFNVNGEGAK